MKKIILLPALLFYINLLFSQNVGIGTTTPDNSALLEIKSTSKGLLLPRMTTAQRNAIVGPVVGLMIFNLDDLCTDIFDGRFWIKNCGLKQTDSTTVAANSWVQKANLGTVGRNGAVGFSIGTKGYVGTGYDDVYKKDFWEYDPVLDTWTQKADLGGVARIDAVGFSIGTKGYIGTGFGGTYLKDFWEYDAATNSWIRKTDFAGVGRYVAVGFAIGTKGYIGTGYDSTTRVKDFWEYNPANNSWIQKVDFGGGGRSGAVGLAIGNKGYIGTGLTATTGNTKDFWEYDPALNSWTQKTDFGGVTRYAATGFSIGTKGYIGTGFDNSFNPTKDFWEYDPALNSWTQKENAGTNGRAYATGFSLGSKGYIGFGYDNIAKTNNVDFWEYNTGQASYPNYSALPIANSGQLTDGIWTKSTNSIYNTAFLNVGIGTTSPTAPLQFSNAFASRKVVLYDAKNNDQQFYGFGVIAGALRYQTDTTTTDHVFYAGSSSTSSNELMRIKGNGNVGIGTNTPSNKLSILGNANISGALAIGTVSGSNKLTVAGNADISGNLALGASFANNKLSMTGNADISGNIGINTLATTYPLNFGSTVGDKISLYGTTPNAPHYGFGLQGSLLQIYTDAATANIGFGYGSSNSFTERATIVNSGVDGMVLSGRLLLKNGTADATNTPGVYFYKADNSALLGFVGTQNNQNLGFYGGPLNFGFTYNTVNSFIGIGNNNPTRPLSFASTTGKKISFYAGLTGDYGMSVESGQLRIFADGLTNKVSFGTDDYVNGYTELGKFERNGSFAMSVFGSIWANSVVYASDERFKQNITPITTPLQKLLQLNGVEYDMKKEAFQKNNFASSRQMGLLAQSVEKVVPEAVSENADGYKGVDYAKLVPLLIEAIKEQQKQIMQQQKEINQLKKL
jgi:hypothetical protein